MRAELERQRKLHAMEAQNVEEARKRVSDMERKHEEAESQRIARENELTNEISQRDNDIKDVREQLGTLRVKSDKLKQKASDEVAALKDKIRQQKEDQMKILNEDLKKIMEIEAEKNGIQEQVERERKEMREKWDAATLNINEQKEQLLEMKRDYESNFSSLQEEKREAQQEKEQFELEKLAAMKIIRDNEDELQHLYTQREHGVAAAEDDIRMKREVLELEIEEKQVKLDAEKMSLTDKIVEHEAMMDHAADSLANTQYLLEVKTREENQKADAAKERFAEMQKKLADSAKKAEEELESKRQHYDELSEQRRNTINKEREIVSTIRSDLDTLVKQLENSKGNERNNLENEIKAKRKRLNEQESQLKLLEVEDKNISEDVEEEFERELSRIQSKAQEDQTALEIERLNLEELQDSKTLKLQKDEQELRDAQKRYNEIKMLLNETRKQLTDVELRSDEASSRKETELLEISRTLEQNLPGTEQHGEVYKLREHRVNLKEIDVEGKMELAEQQEKNGISTEQVSGDIKRITYELEEKDRAKEKLENELKELKEKFARERLEESATLDAMRESIQDMEEEASLGRSLTENEIIYSAKAPFNKLLEKEKIKIQLDMEKKVKEMEERQRREMEEFKRNHSTSLSKLEQERLDLEKQKEILEKEMEKEKVALDKERRMLEREKLEDIDSIIKQKEDEIEDLKEKAQIEIEELRDRLDETEREVCQLQERLTVYTSMANVNLPNEDDDEGADGEVMQYMYDNDEGEMYSSNLSLTGSVTPPRITPPPTPVNQFLRSVNNMRRNQIMVQIPRYILRGLGRDSYHVFEVKVTIGGETWSVYRRYRKFRELHNTMKKMYIEIGELDFPNRRFFGNRAEEFVRARRAQLETYLKSFVTLCANIPDCPVSAFIGRPLTKRDLCDFAPFFKQGIFEQTKAYSS